MNLFASDLHGTLIDCNENAVLESTNYALEKHGRKERLDIEFCKKYQGRTWALYIRDICQNISKDEIEKIVLTAKKAGLKIYPKHVKPMPYALEVLSEVKRRGDEVLIISTTTNNVLDGFLDCIKIREFVDYKIGIPVKQETNDDFDAVEYKVRKLKAFLSKREFENKAMVGDSEFDMEVGNKAGFTTFFFNRENKKSNIADINITDLRETLPFFYK